MSTRLELLKRYLEEDPSDSFLRYAIALEDIKEGRNREAFDKLKSLLDEEPEYLPAYYIAGKSAEAIGLSNDAINFYQRGIAVAEVQRDTHTLSELQGALENLEN
jgi:tetratricopeptide (TPR) repeat protein